MPLDTTKIQFPDSMNIREASLYLDLGEQRIRALHRAGSLPADDSSGRLMFKKTDLDVVKATPRRTGGGGGRTNANGKAFVVRIPADKLQAVTAELGKHGVKLENRYNVEAQKRAQAKQKAKKAVAKTATANNEAVGAQVVTTSAPVAPAEQKKSGVAGILNRK